MRKRAKQQIGAPASVPADHGVSRGPIFFQEDLQRALDALDSVFQDEDMPPGDLRFRQSRLAERLHEHGVSRALSLALFEDLLARGVFRAGESFVNLKICVRLDGHQTDEATPDRYLHTTRERWWSYLAETKAVRRNRSKIPNTRKPSAPKKMRDPKLEARDCWLYKKCYAGDAYKDIKSELNTRCLEKGWRKISSIQGIRSAALTYARAHELAIPPSRQNL